MPSCILVEKKASFSQFPITPLCVFRNKFYFLVSHKNKPIRFFFFLRHPFLRNVCVNETYITYLYSSIHITFCNTLKKLVTVSKIPSSTFVIKRNCPFSWNPTSVLTLPLWTQVDVNKLFSYCIFFHPPVSKFAWKKDRRVARRQMQAFVEICETPIFKWNYPGCYDVFVLRTNNNNKKVWELGLWRTNFCGVKVS